MRFDMKGAPAFKSSRSLAALAAALVLSACATYQASRFDVDAFLRGSDTALSEVLGNTDFLKATLIPQTECAAMLQSPHNGTLEDLPASKTTRGPAWLFHPAATPDKVWLVMGVSGGERSCHGPLPADAMKTLTERAKG
jgi:hypothetical protein